MLLLSLVLLLSPLSFVPGSLAANAGIGAWSQTTSYPSPVVYQSCLADGGDIYCMGGYTNQTFSSSYPSPTTSYFASVSSSGIGQWQSTAPLPVPSLFPSCDVFSGYVYCVGTGMNFTYFALISGSGIGQWVSSTSFPGFSPAGNCAESGGYFYCVGGYANSTTSQVTPYVYYSRLSASGFGPWSESSSFPTQALASQNGVGFCTTYGGYLYCVQSIGEVFSASVSGGSVGQWSVSQSGASGAAFPTCVGSSGYLYCVGGDYNSYSQNSPGSNETSYASVSGNSIGPWVSGGAYPIGIILPACAISSGDIYCVGGVPSLGSVGTVNSESLSAYYAPLNGSPVTTTSTTTSATTAQTTSTATVSSGPSVTISVGSGPAAVTVDTSTGNVYVANARYGSISVISGASNSVIATVQVNGPTTQLLFDPANGDIYAAGGSSVFVISGSSNTVVATIPIIQYAGPSGMALDPSNGDIYISNSDYEVMPVISTQTNSYVANVTLNNAVGYGIAYDPSSGYMYVSGSNSIQVISPGSDSVVNTFTGVNASGVIVFDQGNGYLYAASYTSNFLQNTTADILVVSAATGSVASSIPIPFVPSGVALDPSTGDIYAAESIALASSGATTGTSVAVISDSSNSVIATIPAGSEPWGVAYDSANGRVYVSNAQSGTVTSVSVSPGAAGSTTSTTISTTSTAPPTTTTSTHSGGQQATTSSTGSPPATTTQSSSSSSSGGGVPEFPFQLAALSVLTALVAVSYLLARRRSSPPA